METLSLSDAAEFLKIHTETLSKLVKAGTVPAAKFGKAYVFVKDDLIAAIRKQYIDSRKDESEGDVKCYSKEKVVPITTTSSTSRDKQYTALLEPATKTKRKK